MKQQSAIVSKLEAIVSDASVNIEIRTGWFGLKSNLNNKLSLAHFGRKEGGGRWG